MSQLKRTSLISRYNVYQLINLLIVLLQNVKKNTCILRETICKIKNSVQIY